MKQLLLLLQTEVKCKKNKHSFIWFILIVLITLLISTFWHTEKQNNSEMISSETQIILGIANQDSSDYADIMLSYFRDNEDFTRFVTLVEGEEAVLKKQMKEGKLDCLLVIPENFTKQMIQMEHQQIEAWILTDYPTKAVLLTNVLKNYEAYIAAVEVNCVALYDKMLEDGFSYDEINQANVNISLELIFTALEKDSFFSRRELTPNRALSLTQQYIYSSLVLLLLFACFPIGIQVMKRESIGLSRRMWMANISDLQQLISILLPYLLLAAVFAVAVVGSSAGFWKQQKQWDVIWTSAACFILIVPVLLLLAAFGFLCRRRQTYLLFCSVLFISIAFLGGGFLPVLYLPSIFLPVATRMPNYLFVAAVCGNMSSIAIKKILIYGMLGILCSIVIILPLMKYRREGSQIEE